MIVKQILYILYIFICVNSIIMLNYAIKNEKKNVCKCIILLSAIYLIFLIYDINLIYIFELEMNILEVLALKVWFIVATIFIISIVISSTKLKWLKDYGNSIKCKIISLVLIIFPVVIVSFSYFREMYYINNSELILVYTSGSNFDESTFAYAINDEYCVEVSIGVGFRGYNMEKHLPEGFTKFNYNGGTDRVKFIDNKVVVYRNDKVIYEGKINSKFPSYYSLREIFYK